MNTDAALLRAYVADQSEGAFAELVQRHVGLVYSTALRQLRGDAHAAEDVTQSVFTALARKAPNLVGRETLAGWLYLGVHHAAAQWARTEQRRRAREQNAIMNELSSAEPASDWEQVRPVLDAAMRELGERDREAVLLRYFAGRPFAEIGASLNVSEDAARMRIERALDKLRAALAGRGVTSSTAALGVVLTERAVAAAPAGMAGHVTATALAGSAAPGAIILMTTTKITALLAAAVVAVALGTALHQVSARRAEEERVARTQAEIAGLGAGVNELTQEAAAVEQANASLQRALAAARTASAAAAGSAAGAGVAANGSAASAAADPIAAGNAFLAAHPAVKQALVDRSRARVAARFRAMYPRLALSPDQIRKFEDLMIEYEGITTGDGRTNIMLRPGAGLGRDEVEAGVRALLGDEGYPVYRETAQQAGAQTFATQLAGSLYFTDSPLTPAQAKAMTDVIVEMQTNHAGPADRVGQWDAFVIRVQSVLTPTQVEALQAMHVEEEVQRTLAAGAKQWAADVLRAAQKGGKP